MIRSDRPHVVVVGGGIAGLAAAHRLSLADSAPEVTLLEAAPRLGGKIVTERVDGFVVEGGADSFLAAKPRGVGLCAEVGLADRLDGITPQPHRAFVLHAGGLFELPEGLSGLVPTRLGPIARSGLLSPRGKARLALDYLLPPRRDGADESLAAFVRRRLGAEAYDRLVEPLMAGIYAGDGARLSLDASFPRLRDAEREHGGLIHGVLAARKAASGRDGSGPSSPFVTPRGGLGEMIDALVGRLRAAGVTLRTATPARRLIPTPGGGVTVLLAAGERLVADAVVAAAPAFVAGDLLVDVDPALAGELRAIPHASSAIVSLAYRREAVAHPLDAHGYVVPREEGSPILACTWSSQKWAGRAPDGFVLLRVFLGRWGQEETLAGGDAALVRLARAEVEARLGASGEPLFDRVHRWPHAMPQYVLGHLDRLARIERALATHPLLALAGNAYRGVGVPDCIASGEAAADRLLRELPARSEQGATAAVTAVERVVAGVSA